MAYTNPEWEPWSLETRRILAERNPDQPVEGAGGFTNQTLYEAMKQSGAEYSFQLFGLDSPRSTGGGSFFQQLGDFVTNPAFLTLAGGLAGVAAGGAGAAAGAGSESAGAGLSAELASGAPELAGTMGFGGAGTAATGTSLADASWGVNPQSTSLGTGLTAASTEGGLSAGLTSTTVPTTAPMGAGALGGGITSGATGASGIGTAGVAGTAPSMWDSILGGAKKVAGAMPWGNLAGSVLEYMGQKKSGQTAQNLMQQQIESDPWRAEQSRYFEPLYQAATQGIGNTPYGQSLAETTARKMASEGYDMSGNMPMEIAKSLQGGTTDYLRAVGPLAMGRGESQAPGQFAPSILGAQQGQYGAAGYGLGEILRNWPSSGGSPSGATSTPNTGFGNYQQTDFKNIFL